MLIRPMSPGDLEAVLALTSEAGWGDNRCQFDFYARQPGFNAFVAEVDGRVVGIGAGTQKREVGWVGPIIVTSQHRRQGIGTTLTATVVERLSKLGCRTHLLLATDLGRPVYEKLGFRIETVYHQLKGPTLDHAPTSARLRPLTEADLPGVCALDRQVTGEDRSEQIRALGSRGWALNWAEDGPVLGFYLPAPWGEGPIVALDPADAPLLVDVARAVARLERGQAEMKFSLPAENTAGREHLRRAGFVEASSVTRMVLGEPLEWQPSRVWARFSGALG